MYIHIGQNKAIKSDELIGFFDMDKTTTDRITRDYLNMAEKNGEVTTISYDIPKTFVVTSEKGKKGRTRKNQRIYLNQISTSTLKLRASIRVES